MVPIAADPVAHRRRVRPLRIQPGVRLCLAVPAKEHALLQAAETIEVARTLHRKSPYRDAVDALDSGRILVGPGEVVPGAGGDHLHLVAARKQFGDQAAVELGAAP